MGTTWSVSLALEEPISLSSLQAGIQRELDSVVAEMSHWDPTSHLGRFNFAGAGSWHQLPESFFHVLSYGLQVAEASGGAYDPAAGALVNLWGFGPVNRYGDPEFSPPSQKDIDRLAHMRSAWKKIELDKARRRLLQPGGVLLDLSAIAKGYGVDKVATYLMQQGTQHYLVEVGGELRGAGMKPDGQPWWVRLEQPAHTGAHKTSTNHAILIALHGLSVATSGDYRRYFHHDGERFPHTLDPRTGYPISNHVASVTVIHPECMVADAWSTALTVLGVEQGLALAEEKGLAALFLIRSGNDFMEHASHAFSGMLQ